MGTFIFQAQDKLLERHKTNGESVVSSTPSKTSSVPLDNVKRSSGDNSVPNHSSIN